MAQTPPEDGVDDRSSEARMRTRERQEALLDQALEETFPASDPISPARPREVRSPGPDRV